MYEPNPHLQRGRMLFNQRRLDLAEPELRQAIGLDPQAAEAYALLSLCLLEREAWSDATQAAAQAIALEPANPFSHMILADVYVHRRMFKDARAAIEESLRLDPTDPNAWATLAQIEYAQSRYRQVLAAAEKGLELNGRHEACVNLRAIALTHLGKRSEAAQAIEGTLADNPENSTTHANMGWTLLHQNQPKKALEHFRESLRLDPENTWARQGILEAMKARNIVYRLFLAYFLFMSRLSSKAQWIVILGGYFGIQFLNRATAQYPALDPWVAPIIAIYMIFALGTVVAQPLFNLFLLGNRFGRHVLGKSQKIGAVCFGLSLLPAVVFFILWITRGDKLYSASAFITALWCLPVALAGMARPGRNRLIMVSVAVVLGALCAVLVLQFFGIVPGNVFRFAFYGCLLSPLLANVLASTAAPARR